MSKFMKLGRDEMKSVLGGTRDPLECFNSCWNQGMASCQAGGATSSWCANYLADQCATACKTGPSVPVPQ